MVWKILSGIAAACLAAALYFAVVNREALKTERMLAERAEKDHAAAIARKVQGEEVQKNKIAKVESMTNQKVSQKERDFLTRGGTEIELVNSGLEDTMVTAYNQIRDTGHLHPDIPDLRTTALVCALKKVAGDYISMGIFP